MNSAFIKYYTVNNIYNKQCFIKSNMLNKNKLRGLIDGKIYQYPPSNKAIILTLEK